MSVSVVVGGQYGSESKGKVVSLLARDYGKECAVVRCGGPNSGHIVVENNRESTFRLLPAGCVYHRKGYMAPAAVIDLAVLRREIEQNQPHPDYFAVDPFSVVITEEMKASESGLVNAISSTGSGTGAATAAKCLRSASVLLIQDLVGQNSWLKPYVRCVRSEVNGLIDQGYRVIIEGTQGFGLSLHHSRMFPQTTSKDTTAAQFVMEAGVSPRLVDEVVMVVRTFPIRVAGDQSGPLRNEISWEQLREESGYPTDLVEFTTVTRKRRRVGRFDMDLVLDACQVNRPTSLAIHGLDYLGYENHQVTRFEHLNGKAQNFLRELRNVTGVAIKYAFTGRDNSAVITDTEDSLQTKSERTVAGVLSH